MRCRAETNIASLGEYTRSAGRMLLKMRKEMELMKEELDMCKKAQARRVCCSSCAAFIHGIQTSACDPKPSVYCARCVATCLRDTTVNGHKATWAYAVKRCRGMGLNCACVPCGRAAGCSKCLGAGNALSACADFGLDCACKGVAGSPSGAPPP